MIFSIYGFGKMKTESAIGTTIRAIQKGDRVLFTQFLKDGRSNEIKFLNTQKLVDTVCGKTKKITLPNNLTDLDKEMAQQLLKYIHNELKEETYKLIILDEILPALDMELISEGQIRILIQQLREFKVDAVLTGRIRKARIRHLITELSDIVTDAYCVKHRFNTHCTKCGRDYPYHYTFCPDCSTELVKSKPSKEGRDY